jgi:hypothetical protein
MSTTLQKKIQGPERPGAATIVRARPPHKPLRAVGKTRMKKNIGKNASE